MRLVPLLALAALLAAGPAAPAQVPPPDLGADRAVDLAARRAALLRDEHARRAAVGLPTPPAEPADGATRFVPLDEVVPPPKADPAPPAEADLRREFAGKLFDLAMEASQPPVPLAFVDACLRDVLQRQPGHPEARRLLGFVPHGQGGWATPFAAAELAAGKVKDPTFGWVPADWVPHLARGELPNRGARGWLPAAEADALRTRGPCKNGWEITTEHFRIHANVPLSGVIAFGRQLETFHGLFFALIADVLGPDRLPLARRLADPKLQPKPDGRPRHEVYYFATRDEYVRHLAPAGGAGVSLGIYLPRREAPAGMDQTSYFFDDPGGQLDVVATLYHEVSHQLLFESAGPTGYARNLGHYWVFEGLGTYFETVQPRPDGSIRVGGLVGPRLASARAKFVDRDEWIPLGPFARMSRDAFNGAGGGDVYLHYAEAMALAVTLMQARDGRDRAAFLDYAADAYRGQFARGAGLPLDARIGRNDAAIRREVLDHLARIPPPPRPAGN